LGNGFCDGGVQITQDNESFFKVTPFVWSIEGQNNNSYRAGGFDLKKREKFTLFEKFPSERGGEGGSGEVGMDSQLFPVFNYESFP